MIKDLRKEQYGYEGKVYFPLFDKEIAVHFDEKEYLEYAERCVKALSELSPQIVKLLCEFSQLYCTDFCEYVGEDAPEMKVPEQVLKYIDPTVLIVDEHEGEGIALHLELNCDWEEEHGMEWLIRNDEVLYVGSFDGVSAWDEKEEYKDYCGNYAFGNILCEDEKF